MIDDLRHLPDNSDSFQLITPDLAIVLLCIIILLGAILERFL